MSVSALLVIDLANDFVYPGGTIADAGGPEYQARVQAMLPRLARLVESARERGILVIYATDAHTPDDSELRKWPPHAMAGTRESGGSPISWSICSETASSLVLAVQSPSW